MADNLNYGGGIGMPGFLVGALIGAGLALLLAPYPGDETRRRLAQGARKLGQDAKRGLDQAVERVDEIKNRVSDVTQPARSEMRTAGEPNRIS